MVKTFKIITLGCKVNQYESAYISEALSRPGWRKAMDTEKADVSIVNTCIVTQTASRQSRQEIRKAIRENPEGMVVATGCYAQVFPDELSEIGGIGLVADNTQKGKLPGLLLMGTECNHQKTFCSAFEKETPFEFLPIKSFSNRARAFLKIQDGCESFCSYCIVPLARGPYRSLPSEKVLDTIRSLAENGYREIVLTGIHLGKYGFGQSSGMNLNRLLAAIGKEGLPVRIRLSSLEVNEIDGELIDMMVSEDWLCRHFHIPLQSGDNRVLKRMRRHYTASQFARLIDRIHLKIPFAAIGTDIMSGFPGEDAAAHQNTYALMNDLPISYVHIFPYSPRNGTAASRFSNQVAPVTIKKRAAELRELGQRKKKIFYHSCLGKRFLVLPEGWHSKTEGMMKGKTDNYLPVIFSFKKTTSRFVSVLLEKAGDDNLTGSA